MRARLTRSGLLFVTLGAITACGGRTRVERAEIVWARARVNPTNSLSALVEMQVRDADSIRVGYWEAGGVRTFTPYEATGAEVQEIAVLGLAPSRRYWLQPQARNGGTVSYNDSIPFVTSELPPALRKVEFSVDGTPSPGYVIAALLGEDDVAYVVAFDGTGAIRWYRGFPGGLPPVDVRRQANGNFTVFLGTSAGWNPVPGSYTEFTPEGRVVRSFSAGNGLYTDPHELVLTFSGRTIEAVHLFGYELRTVDMSPFGGLREAKVAGHTLMRQDLTGSVEFSWSAWDHFTLEDWIELPAWQKELSPIDFDHPNGIAFDLDGHYLVSWRHLSEVTKIDAGNGRILWRLGGRNNQFAFLNDPMEGFNGAALAGRSRKWGPFAIR